MAKRMTALGSAHQIGLSTCLEGVLIVVLGSSSLGRFPQYLHNQSRYGKTDGSVGFSASNRSIHVLGRRFNCSWGACHRWTLKKQRNWSRFHLYLHNQGRYGKPDDGVGFSTSNRSIHVLGRRSNCSWGFFIAGL